MQRRFEELVDVPALQELVGVMCSVQGIAARVVGGDGQTLVSAGCVRICDEFCRAQPEMRAACPGSGSGESQPEPPHPYAIRTCPQGMVEASFPILVDGVRVATALCGPVLLEAPSPGLYERFAQLARCRGLQEPVCLQALEAVPVLAPERFHLTAMLLGRLAEVIAANAQRRVQADVRPREGLYHALFEQAVDPVFVLQTEHGTWTVMDANAAALRAHGYRREQLVGQAVTLLDRACGTPRMVDIVRQAESKGPAIFEVTRPDGEGNPLEVEVRAWRLRSSLGKVILVAERDITERNRVARHNRALDARIFQTAKMEAVARLAGGIAHDFNNLLTSISGNIALALLDLQAGHPATELLQDAAASAGDAASLTRQLLAFSRSQVAEPRVVDLNHRIASLLGMLGSVLREDIPLTFRPALESCPVWIDPGQFEQVLVNVAINAREAMPSGGTLTIATRRVSLEAVDPAGEVAVGSYVAVEVTDTGEGMNDEVKAHLFEPFFSTRSRAGAGLGLATSFGMIAQAQGWIDVDSRPGEGTRLEIFLPAACGPISCPPSDAPAPGVRGGGETILLVEDQQAVRALTARMLRRLGYEVIPAGDGPEALAVVQRHQGFIELLLTDVVMPRMNGPELVEKVVALHPGVKVLYTSGYARDITERHGVRGEERLFLCKPFTLEALARKVREALDRG